MSHCIQCGRDHEPNQQHGGGVERTMEEKQRLYRAGQYRFPVPPVTTIGWDEPAWIRWIDWHGQWMPVVLP